MVLERTHREMQEEPFLWPMVRAAWQSQWMQQLVPGGSLKELPGVFLPGGCLLAYVLGSAAVLFQTPRPA